MYCVAERYYTTSFQIDFPAKTSQNIRKELCMIIVLQHPKHYLDYGFDLQTEQLVFVRLPQCQLWTDLVTNAPTIPCFPLNHKCRHEWIVARYSVIRDTKVFELQNIGLN